jgi:diguanylate cyclase (GGDEF)-like protein/PAS domain S-box-containing protein
MEMTVPALTRKLDAEPGLVDTARPEAAAVAPVRSRASIGRIALTVLCTVLVVVGEFALLSTLYHRADSLRAERVTVSRIAGLLAASPAATPAMIGQLRDLSATLSRNSPVASAALRSSVAQLAPGAWTRPASGLAAQLDARVKAKVSSLDNQADGSYVLALVAVSLGWMVWFRRLVGRHRSLEHKFTEQQTRATHERRLAALGRNSADVVVVCDRDLNISLLTESARTVLGLDPEVSIGLRLSQWIHPDDVSRLMVVLTLGHREDQVLAVRMLRADGRFIAVEGVVTDLHHDEAIGGLVFTFRDVSARHELEGRLQHQAFHDVLTGLANRQLFTERLGHALEPRRDRDLPLAVLFCDLDDFKDVNDSRGHGVGDCVLAEVGRRVSDSVRGGDTAARLGGDEFAVLMEGATLEQAQGAAERLLAALSEPIVIEQTSFTVSVSIGIAQAVPGEMSSEDVLRNADVAMYLAKERGKSGVALYSSRLHAEALERMELRVDLQRAIANDELFLHFQPTVDLSDGTISGFEALVRWNHPTRGLLPPVMFIPMAEESGLIVPLGSWVLGEACAAAVKFQSLGSSLGIAVNVSAQQLARPSFVDEVTQVLARSGLHSNRLTLEITEGVILDDLDAVGPRLVALRKLGVRIAIDDFGTGYSSLSYLRHLPVDVLKIDKSFIDRVATDKADASLASAIIALSRSMNLVTVAEGVEDRDQAAWLTAARCVFGQGYLWSRPVSFEDAVRLCTVARLPAAGRAGTAQA